MTKHLIRKTHKQENLIKALGIESLPDAQKIEIIDRASDVIEQRLFIRLLSTLSDEQKEEFMKISDDPQKSEEFMNKYAPDFIDWIDEETEKIKKELKGLGDIE